ncbi:type II secretion system F family protein [Nocardioides euryhalodurans]|uniref:Type II secretion system F family protein n=1 Tax=Nocardioides euryhalodurans TaxID=2518370 RepID=A0A4P7GQ88_9ACTN|nr:type II secretion system F family protein [Nocardioides euryhalodurans]QBR94199.1 type II secretion system F family protein [Nocardioides euryhalodurans]
MTLLFVAGVTLVLVSIVLLGMAVAKPQPEGVHRSIAVLEAMSSAPKELTQELDRPFGERVLDPLRGRALSIGKRLTGSDSADRIRQKLDLAGNPGTWTVDRVISSKVLGAVVGVVAAFGITALLGTSLSLRIVIVVGGLVLGYVAPNLYLYQVAYDRSAKMQRELPDAIDLMTISVESGLGFDAAVQQVATNTDGPLADELARVLREMQIGQSRSESLRNLSERTNVPELKSFVSAMVQADAFGIPIAQVLRVQSSEIRVKRRQAAEEKAMQVPVKITIPLIFCILPCLFIAVMGPAAITALENFS